MAKGIIIILLCTFSIHSRSQKNASPLLKYDSVTVATSNQYGDPGFFKQLFLGKNYRNVWETPVTLPVFDLKSTNLKIVELGGGMQTKSLELVDKQGREWALRTIDKYVVKAIPPILQNTIAHKVVQDMVSGAHPYSPLIIPGLAKAVNVPVPQPVFYFVPDDPAFGEHQAVFANTICMLEQKEPTPDNSNAKNTENFLEDLAEDNDQRIIQKQVLRARLIDMLVGDWDRHADQWRWGNKDSAKLKYWYAIPRDRDQAFFNSGGLLVKVATLFGMRHLVGFRDDLTQLKNLNYKSWNFDALFLNELTKKEWREIILSVQSQLTNTVIDNAVQKLPPPIYALNGAEFESKLKSRRDDLLVALNYYDFIARVIPVFGTVDNELFEISGSNGKLLLQVFNYDKGKKGQKLYERLIDEKETHEVTLNGLQGNDSFIIHENASSGVNVNIHGGDGADVYDIKGKVKTKIYDSKDGKNEVKNSSKTKLRFK